MEKLNERFPSVWSDRRCRSVCSAATAMNPKPLVPLPEGYELVSLQVRDPKQPIAHGRCLMMEWITPIGRKYASVILQDVSLLSDRKWWQDCIDQITAACGATASPPRNAYECAASAPPEKSVGRLPEPGGCNE